MPKIQRIGNSHGVVLPSAELARANLAAGDDVVIGAIQDGVVVAAAGSAAGRMIKGMLDSMDHYAESYRLLASEALSDEPTNSDTAEEAQN